MQVLQPGEGAHPGRHVVAATPDNVLWGYLPNATTRPLLTVADGDTVTIDTLSHEGVLSAAVGSGPTLPFPLFARAVETLGGPATPAARYELLADARLQPLFRRAAPGTADEHIGFVHPSLRQRARNQAVGARQRMPDRAEPTDQQIPSRRPRAGLPVRGQTPRRRRTTSREQRRRERVSGLRRTFRF